MFVSQIALSQSAEDLFKKANTQYKEGQYEKAIVTYHQIKELNLISSEVHYNLGNCHYKLNEVAPAIYHYEKALLIDPLNEDARNNLIFAKKLTIDNIKELPTSIFQKMDESYIKKLSYNEWAIATIVFVFLWSSLFLLFYFSYIAFFKNYIDDKNKIMKLNISIYENLMYKDEKVEENTKKNSSRHIS